MRLRTAAVVVAGAIVALGSMAGVVSAARVQDSGGTFSGIASADAVRVNVAVPNYLLIRDFVDGGGPSAQAVLDSLGASRAFASFPYPGELGVAATGLVSTLTGFSLPSYPFVAASDHPVQPERDIAQPGFRLHAKSDAESSFGNAVFGESTASESFEAGGIARASVTSQEDGAVLAEAETRFSTALGPVVLRGVRARASVTRTLGGAIKRTSSLEVGGLSIAGVEVGVTERGLVIAGAPLVPIDVLTGLTGVLTFGDTTIRFLPQTTTDDSVLSAGLEITTSIILPVAERPLLVTYRIGNVFASVNGSAFDSDAAPSAPLPPEVALGEDGFAPSFGNPVVEDGARTPDGIGVPSPTATRRRVGDAVRVSSWTFFPILVLVGMALLAGTFGERWQHSRDSNRGEH